MSLKDPYLLADEAAKAQLQADIEAHGWHIGYLESNGYTPRFAFTIGLFTSYGHPEIICFGMHKKTLTAVLGHLAERVKAGEKMETGKPYTDFLDGFPVQFVEVLKAHYPKHLGPAAWHYDDNPDFPALQMVWPDPEQKWPWEEGFPHTWKLQQPLLDRNADFHFYESEKTAVITTRQVLEEGAPILLVTHDAEGDWQMVCGTTADPDDGKVVSLSQIVALDPSLNDLFNLPFNWKAWRESADQDWQLVGGGPG